MIVLPIIKNNVYLSAHPTGLEHRVQARIAYVEHQPRVRNMENVLVYGASTGNVGY